MRVEERKKPVKVFRILTHANRSMRELQIERRPYGAPSERAAAGLRCASAT